MAPEHQSSTILDSSSPNPPYNPAPVFLDEHEQRMSLLVRSAHFAISISRALGTVVVAVHGDLEAAGARHLGSVLDDIIEGQGNLAVVVDLHEASAVDASGLAVFATAAEQATKRGAVLTLSDPPDVLYQALSLQGLGRLVRTTRHDGRRPCPSVPLVGSLPLAGHPPPGAGHDPAQRDEGQRQGDSHLQPGCSPRSGTSVTTSGAADTVEDRDSQRAMWAVGKAHVDGSRGGTAVITWPTPGAPESPSAPGVAAAQDPSVWWG